MRPIPLFNYSQYRIIMETYVRFNGQPYVYFPEGIPYYSLYRTKRKINSFSELEYVAEKFIHLNPEFNLQKMISLFVELSDRESGHIIRTYSQDRVTDMVYRVYDAKKQPYVPRLRKIIFNPSKNLSRSQKMEIVGNLIGRKSSISKEDMLLILEDLYMSKERISVSKIAELTDTSRYIITKSIDDEIRGKMINLNQKIREENYIAKIIEAIEELTSGGCKIKMRRLKEITSVRDYSMLKKAVSLYQKNF